MGHPGAGRIFLRCAADESSTVHPNYEPSLSHSSEPVVFIEQQRLTFIARSKRATNSPNELEGGQVMVTEERLIVFLVKNHNNIKDQRTWAEFSRPLNAR